MKIFWQQFGAAIDMLENAIRACPVDLWGDRSRHHQVWYMSFHTLFWLDLYLSGPAEGFSPPKPFGLEELDPAGVMPEQVYSQEELLSYLDHCRRKCHDTIHNLNEQNANRQIRHGWGEVGFTELLIYNMRHVQHHTAQLNMLLRLETDSAPRCGDGEKPAMMEFTNGVGPPQFHARCRS